MKKILVGIPEGIYEVIQKELKGKLGKTDSEVIRTIVIAYLSKEGYLKKEEK